MTWKGGAHEKKTDLKRYQKKQTVYRAAVPFEAIGLNETVKKRGFRLNLIVNDNDGEMRESCIGVAPGIAENKDPERYPIIKFR